MKSYLVLFFAIFSIHQATAKSFDWYIKEVSDPKSIGWATEYGDDIHLKRNVAIAELLLTEKLNWNYPTLVDEPIDNKLNSISFALIFPRDVSGNPYQLVVNLNGTRRELLEGLANKMGIAPDQLKVVYAGNPVDLNSDELLSTLDTSVEQMTMFRLISLDPARQKQNTNLIIQSGEDQAVNLEIAKIDAILKDMDKVVKEDILRQPAGTRAARAAKWIAELERTKGVVGFISTGGGIFTSDF